ncbi:marvel domain-containing protein [Xylariales sp. PMI_506]|nr:marvel domain-containing protein [Xylariales sp. PMI_506]
MHSIVPLAVRVISLLAAAVVLGLSVTLAKQQVLGKVPSETGFSSFAGAFGIIVAVIGIAALFVERLPGMLTMITDGLASVFFLAGGIALAIAMKNTPCSSNDTAAAVARFENKILNGGCDDIGCYAGGSFGSDALDSSTQNSLKGRCTRAEIDFAFEFIAMIFTLGALVSTFLIRKSAGKAVFV